ncbi:MAG: twin-arginine translocation signal domain-containing protein, partial [Phycisphaerales bacterium]|nr:twin-arginine translocation signal domain-containing protein [Phycisphaerales bacterium]
MQRRDFLKQSLAAAGALGAAASAAEAAKEDKNAKKRPAAKKETAKAPAAAATKKPGAKDAPAKPGAASHAASAHARPFNGPYTGANLAKIAFPMGGIGAGMICLEGTGALSHVSLRHHPDVFNEPQVFAALCVKGKTNIARVLEGPVPEWKVFGPDDTGNGATGRTYGLPRFRECTFNTRFPFATIALSDDAVPLKAEITGWSPFVPPDADNSSLPVAALEYTFINSGTETVEAVFSFNSRNFIAMGGGNAVMPAKGGFTLRQNAPAERPWEEGSLVIASDDPAVKVNHAWFRGGWWDSLTTAWRDVENGAAFDREPITQGEASPGATLFVPFTLGPGAKKQISLRIAWYIGRSNLTAGKPASTQPADPPTHIPWYAERFRNIDEVVAYWRDNYDKLRGESAKFSDAFYDSSLPPEVIEAIAANLTIIKSPTVLRQTDGRLWGWEGCKDKVGCCLGSCTHVWNYAQAIPHLFPTLERTLRESEFTVSQNDEGHQTFRTVLPIRQPQHDFHAAADGQLGGIMKVHRDWRISGDTEWLRKIWPKVRQSLDYCIKSWDPEGKGTLEEPHHNTYDIEFWGPDGMCTSFYLGALAAAVAMGTALKDDVSKYQALYDKGRKYMETELWDGEYFIQRVKWEGLKAKPPTEFQSMNAKWSPEAIELLKKEGPKYQYGTGCLSDGVLGAWIAEVCGLNVVLDAAKLRSHLKAIHAYNLKRDLSAHANPQRPSYAVGDEGGLLLCSWPKGGKPTLPFVYSDEVWTGIEYQAAAHMMLAGLTEEGCEVVRVARERYDGRVRNPFNEYECGHWYARAMSSYGMLQGLTGIRYDAVDKTLHVHPRITGDFRSFLATATGFGIAGVREGKPFFDVKSGTVDVQKIDYKPAGQA